MIDYLAIDYGTTNSLAGVVDDQIKLKLVPLEGQSFEMPSAVFLKSKDYQRLVFNQDEFENRVHRAVNKQIERSNNLGTAPTLPRKSIVAIQNDIKITMDQELLDDELEALRTQTFFTALNNPDFIPCFGLDAINQYKDFPIGGFFMRSPKAFLAIKLIESHKALFIRTVALTLSEIKLRAESYCKKTFSGVVLGRPVNYMGANTEDGNLQALDIMRQAARRAGFSDVRFVIEPMAASLVISKTIFDSDTPALVIDIGGGTTDVILLDVDTSAQEKLRVLSASGERIGGNDFDETLAISKVGPFIGAGAILKKGTNVPNEIVLDALSTRDIYKQISFRKRGEEINALISQALEPYPIERLYQVFQMQLQHRLLLVAEEFKKEVSSKGFYESKLSFFNRPFSITVNSEELSLIYSKELRATKQLIFRVLNESSDPMKGLRVFLTGGMSNSPTLIEAIKDAIPKGTVINTIGALQTVAAGLAVVARQLALSENSFSQEFNVRGIPVTR